MRPDIHQTARRDSCGSSFRVRSTSSQKTKGSKQINVPKGKIVPTQSKEEEAKVKAEEIVAKERAKKLEISLLNHVQLKLEKYNIQIV